MKSYLSKALVALAVFGLALFGGTSVFAEGDEENSQSELKDAATSISISPVSKILKLVPDTTYENVLNVTNNSSSPMDFEVYAAPYSYLYSESENIYKLGFNNETAYTQITRWITFQTTDGGYATKATYTAEPGQTVAVTYKISTPSSIPAGGQYAVVFAHTLSSSTLSNGIRTEASPGLVIYGRADGETVYSSEISSLEIRKTVGAGDSVKNLINATARVKNTGNVDFMAYGKLKVTGVFGKVYYETPDASTKSRTSVIPDVELEVSDSWDDTPFFGLFNVEWTVDAAGKSETITTTILILPAVIVVTMILLLTIIAIWIIIMVRKRKERRAKFNF